MNEQIRKLAQARKIPFLVHFTRTRNIPSIMEHGLVPRSLMKELGIEAQINDEERYDYRLGGTSTSIAFPNGRMFFKLRQEDETEGWAILAIKPQVIWEKDALFCRHNAADRRISGLSDDELRTPAAFESLFEEIEGLSSRTDQALSPYDPTDVQAEVFIQEIIDPGLILGGLFDSKEARDEHVKIFGEKNSIYHRPRKGLFAERTYFRRFKAK